MAPHVIIWSPEDVVHK